MSLYHYTCLKYSYCKFQEYGVHSAKYYKVDIIYFQSKFEAEIIKLIYKNYWLDTLSSNILLVNNDYYTQTVDDMSKKVKNFSLLYD